jgi:hypothetical protein
MVNRCPICGKLADIYTEGTTPAAWKWHHNCEGIFICSEVSFREKENAESNWNKYAEKISDIIMAEYTNGYERGFIMGEMEIEK